MRIDPACTNPVLLAAEVRRLQAVIAESVAEHLESQDAEKQALAKVAELEQAIRRLADQDATLSVCDGAVTVTIEAALTDAEREAVETAARIAGAVGESDVKATLRGLLERHAKGGET